MVEQVYYRTKNNTHSLYQVLKRRAIIIFLIVKLAIV